MARMTVPEFKRTIVADGSNNLDSTNPTGSDGSPLAPTNFTASYLSDTSLSLAWTDNATDEDNFELDRSLTGTGGWTALSDPAANATSATSTGLTVDTQYFYRLRAVNTFGNSTYATANGTTTESVIVFVSTTGNDTTGDGTELLPWRTPEFGGKQLTNPGDTLEIKAGTYILNESNLPVGHTTMDRFRSLVSPPNNVSGTALLPITIRAAAGETVLLDGGVSPEWPTVGTNLGDYTVIDGVESRGCALLWGSTGSTVKNCDLYGGIDTPISNGGDNFGCVIRTENSIDCFIINNKMHDNQQGISLANSPLLMEFDTTGLIVEFNDVYNSVDIGIRLKDNPESIIIRSNFIHDNVTSGIQGANQDLGNNVTIHNNVLLNNNTSNSDDHGGITGNVLLDGWEIYNNTFYSNGFCDIRMKFDTATDYNLWNNIHDQSLHYYRSGFSSSGSLIPTVLTFSDFNDFFGGGAWQSRSTVYANLAAFNTALGYDGNSVTTDPSFINAGGSTPEDYKRSSYPTNGRGGSFEDVMGAYIDGTEQIGADF